jgi:hypothetical protein
MAPASIAIPNDMDSAAADQPRTARDILFLLFLTVAAILVQGYHLGIEDNAVYLPAIKKLINPSLYPYDANFFLLFTRWTLFHRVVAVAARITHLPLVWLIFLLHIASVFLILLGCLQLIRKCFREPAAQCAGVTFVAALLTMPVAGAAIFITDQHLHPRNFAAAFLLFAAVAILDRQPRALLWIFLTGLCHPTMAVYGTFHLAILALGLSRMPQPAIAFGATIPLGAPPNPIWRKVMAVRSFHYPFMWAWYEWIGALAPIGFFELFARIGRRAGMPVFARVSRMFAISTLLGIAIAVFFSEFFQMQTQTWARLEPMRVLHFPYVVFLLFSGGLLGKYVLRDKPLRWAALFIPLAFAMFHFQRLEFPSSHHIEWPGRPPRNAWVQAFDWVRENTPQNAFFVLDPGYMSRPGEDFYGFRAYSERSMLADNEKDASAVALFPDLAWQWDLEVTGRKNWVHFTLDDFDRLKKKYGVNWVIVERPGVPGLTCPYSNRAVMVCQIP